MEWKSLFRRQYAYWLVGGFSGLSRGTDRDWRSKITGVAHRFYGNLFSSTPCDAAP